jgi:hypothetical protein
MGPLFAILRLLFWRKDDTQGAKGENTEQERGFDCSRHGKVEPTRPVKLVSCSGGFLDYEEGSGDG